VFLFIRRLRAVHKQVFGAVQADTVRLQFAGGIDVLRKLDVDGESECLTIQALCRFPDPCAQGGGMFLGRTDAALIVGQGAVVHRGQHYPSFSVHHQGFPLLQSAGCLIHPQYGWDIQAAGKNGGV